MKKLTYIFLLAAVFVMNGCLHDVQEIFDEPASIRMQNALAEYNDLLTSSANGWFADYYPEDNQKIGGYAMFLKFSSTGFVDISCEIPTNVSAVQAETSQYELIADQGPVLSFSTYNPVLHYFSEPNSSDYDGLYGDYEFIVMKASQDTIEMKGKKHGNKLVLRRNKENVSPETYFSQVTSLEDILSEFGMFNFALNGNRIGMVAVIDRTFSIGYKNDNDEDETLSVSYTFTPTGIRLYEPFVFEGVTMQNFIWSTSEEKYVCSDPGVNAFFDVYFPEDYELRYSELIGTWRMQYHGTSTSVWDYANIEISQRKKNATYTLTAPDILEFPIEVTFDAQKGIVSIFTHHAGIDETTGYTIRVCPYDRAAGYLYTNVGGIAGIIGKWNHDEGGERMITFEDNGRWQTYKANGLIVRLYEGSTSRGNFTANIGGHRFNDITITKIID